MKIIKLLTPLFLIVFLLCSSNEVRAQNGPAFSIEGFADAFNTVPDYFAAWVKKIELIANAQDKKNLRVLMSKIGNDITDLKSSKLVMLELVDQGVNKARWEKSLDKVREDVTKLSEKLKKARDLSDGLSLPNANDILNVISNDVQVKGVRLEHSGLESKNNRTVVKQILNKSIEALAKSETILKKAKLDVKK